MKAHDARTLVAPRQPPVCCLLSITSITGSRPRVRGEVLDRRKAIPAVVGPRDGLGAARGLRTRHRQPAGGWLRPVPPGGRPASVATPAAEHGRFVLYGTVISGAIQVRDGWCGFFLMMLVGSCFWGRGGEMFRINVFHGTRCVSCLFRLWRFR